jgi:hypothetical protein
MWSGTCDATLDSYRRHVRDLLKSIGEDPGRFDAQSRALAEQVLGTEFQTYAAHLAEIGSNSPLVIVAGEGLSRLVVSTPRH